MDASRQRRSWLRVPGATVPDGGGFDVARPSSEGQVMGVVALPTFAFPATRVAFEAVFPMSGVKDEAESLPPVPIRGRRTLAARKSVAE